jgi:ribosomal protein S18 acetylase RimI-like enzyme
VIGELEWISAADLIARHRDEVAEVWGQTMGGGRDKLRERIDVILPRHAGRDGFRFVASRAEDGSLAGFAYGYLGAAGQWWHDIVAAAMTDEQERRWLAHGHFEFVELHVRPDHQRRGIGGRLHDALLDGLDAPTAVLSTQQENAPAIALYEQRDWEIVLPSLSFLPSEPPYVIMGKELRP